MWKVDANFIVEHSFLKRELLILTYETHESFVLMILMPVIGSWGTQAVGDTHTPTRTLKFDNNILKEPYRWC